MNLARSALLPHGRGPASLVAMDVTKWFGETSGGVRTYLLQKQRYVAGNAALRHVLVIPGEHDSVTDGDGTRTYRLRGPRIPTRKPYRFLLATQSLSRIVRHERPDIIEVGSPLLVPWLARFAARPLDIPLVNFFHSNFPRLVGTSWAGRAAEGCAWWYAQRLNAMFQCTIVASDFAARELADAGVERTIRIPLGVDLDHFHPRRSLHRTETCIRFGIPDGPLALFVGRLAREKELDVLVDAWPQVHRATGATLILVGDGPMGRTLQRRTQGKHIIMLPFQNDRHALADLLAAATVYISPGSLETFGLSALEALASGTPVISAHRGGVAEQVQRSGAGALFDSGRAASLTDAVITLLRGDPTALGIRGRRYAEQEHAWDVVFDRIFRVYRDILHGRSLA